MVVQLAQMTKTMPELPDAILPLAEIDDELGGHRCLGRPPKLSDSELLCLAVAQVLLGCRSEARWLRFVGSRLAGMFPYLPQRPGCNKRLRSALPLVK